MSFEEFQKTLASSDPVDDLSDHLKSLWYDGKGNWSKAHSIIQNIEDKSAASIHAYLHRKEGDIGNADYWYRMAGKNRPDISLKEEWQDLVKTLL